MSEDWQSYAFLSKENTGMKTKTSVGFDCRPYAGHDINGFFAVDIAVLYRQLVLRQELERFFFVVKCQLLCDVADRKRWSETNLQVKHGMRNLLCAYNLILIRENKLEKIIL